MVQITGWLTDRITSDFTDSTVVVGQTVCVCAGIVWMEEWKEVQQVESVSCLIHIQCSAAMLSDIVACCYMVVASGTECLLQLSGWPEMPSGA